MTTKDCQKKSPLVIFFSYFQNHLGLFCIDISCALLIAVIGVGGYMIMKKQMDYPDLVTFALYIASFVSPMRSLSRFSEMFANGFAGLNRFVSIMRTEPTLRDLPDAKPLENVKGDIRVEDVSFTYDGDLDVLHNVSLHVQPGETVAIARIFLKNPPILILDEATSALDSVTEAKIQRAFDALAVSRTTLIIAHRLSTIRAASRIIAIADGVIAEAGTHEELLQKGGIYAGLYNTQHSA